jgi:hypothetical protein
MSSSSSSNRRSLDPLTRTALRYSLSPREYELLYEYLISRAPPRIQKRAPNPPRYAKITKSSSENGDENIAALRAALRVFVGTYVGLKGWNALMQKLASRRAGGKVQVKAPVAGFYDARYALALSSILLFQRLLHRFFRRLRRSLQEEQAEPFRKRNPLVTRLLTSPYTPAAGSALSGFFLGLAPADQLRLTLTIYTFTRTLEFSYNALDDAGYLWDKKKGGKPWWFGSWLIMPFACGQLLHAFVFDRECFPESYGRFILQRSPEYIQLRPSTYPKGGRPWPGTFDIVDALAELSKLRWPPFVSPILFPTHEQTLPSGPILAKISPITAPAHPLIKHTSCALLHPHDPSCARTYLKYWFKAFPAITKFFTLVYSAFALLAYKRLLKSPWPFLDSLSARILRAALFITGAIGTSWGSICLFANYLPRSTLPTQRWFLGGFMGGLWAFVARDTERSTFLYSLRLSLESLWKVGKRRGWWKGIKGGDVAVFVASLALLQVVYEQRPKAVQGGVVRKGLSLLRGEGWVDKVAPIKGEEEGGG